MVTAIGDEAWAVVIQWHDRTLEELIFAGDGRVATDTGDGFLDTFDDVASAIDCAVDIQRSLARHGISAGYAPGVRMGVNAGPIIRGTDGVSGVEIHETARIAAAGVLGEILVDAAHVGDTDSRFPLGAPRVVPGKGVDEEVSVVSVAWR